jgi:hypothetical protein
MKIKRILKIFISRVKTFFRRGLLGRFLLQEIKSRTSYYKSHEIRKTYGKDMPDKTVYVIGADEGGMLSRAYKMLIRRHRDCLLFITFLMISIKSHIINNKIYITLWI